MSEILILILIVIFGYLLINLISTDIQFMEKLSLSFLVGLGLSTNLIFLYSWFGIKVTLISVLCMFLIASIILLALHKKYNRKLDFNFKIILKSLVKIKWYEGIICIIICIILLASFLSNVYYPVIGWDSLALYDFTAKVITQMGYFVQIANKFSYFSNYPLLTSIAHAMIYLVNGANPKFIYALFYSAFAVLCYGFMRRYSNRLVALVFTLIIISNPILFTHSTLAYTNLPYTVYLITGIFYLFYGLTEQKDDYLVLSAILTGLSTWTRSAEPFWLVGIIFVLIYAFIKRRLSVFIKYLLVFLVIQQPWKIFQTMIFGSGYATSNQFVAVGSVVFTGINKEQLAQVFQFIYDNILLKWGYIFPLSIILIFLNLLVKDKKNKLLFLSIMIFNFLILIWGVYYFSLSFPDWRQIPDSATRMSMFFPPMVICYSALLLAGEFKIFSRNTRR